MAEVERRRVRGGWRYISGVVSLVLAGVSGAALVALVALVRISEEFWPSAGEIDAPGIGLLVFFFVAACLLSVVAALFLSAAALVKPGRGWRFAVAGWMVGASALAFVGVQSMIWSPYGNVPEGPPPDAAMIQDQMPQPEMPPEIIEEQMMMEEEMGASPGTPPEAILTSNAPREAVGLEGTFCWAPNWAENCVEDAGIPLPDGRDTVDVQTGEAVDVTFVLRSVEGQFSERDPKLTGAAVYPLDQPSKTVPAPRGEGYLIPGGQNRKLQKRKLDLKRENGPAKIVADVPAGEYVLQVSARSPDGAGSWSSANYHFRIQVF